MITNRIFFAGEATASAYSTVRGADRSGRRVVNYILYSSSVLKNT